MKLERHKGNPILGPHINPIYRAVFNPAAVFHDGKVHLLVRTILKEPDKEFGETDEYKSWWLHAHSKNGIDFECSDRLVFGPGEDYDCGGCEDPRGVVMDGRVCISYSALLKLAREGGGPPTGALVFTEDFKTFDRHGIITPDGADERNVVLFPRKIDGEYVMIHRPYNWKKKNICEKGGTLYLKVKGRDFIKWPLEDKPAYFPEKPTMWISFSKDLENWHNNKVLINSEEMGLDFNKIGAGSPPIETDEGWLLLFHLNGMYGGVPKYKVGAALLDLEDPSKLIAVTRTPIFEPEEHYEINGDLSNVVFPTGNVLINGELLIYYGAADMYVGLATCSLDELVKTILSGK